MNSEVDSKSEKHLENLVSGPKVNETNSESTLEVESKIENKPEVISTKPEMKSEVDSKHLKNLVSDPKVNQSNSEPRPEVEPKVENQPEVILDSTRIFNAANKNDESDKIQNINEKTEKPFEPKMENGIETININQIDRHKNEIEVNANTKIDVNVNNDKNDQNEGSKGVIKSRHPNESSKGKDLEVNTGSNLGSNEVKTRRSKRAQARDKYGPELREVFKKIDKDGSGYASIDEMW